MLKKSIAKTKKRLSRVWLTGKKKVKKNPFLIFSALLLILLVLIIAGNLLRKPETVEEQKTESKEVEAYRIGKAPVLKFQGKVEKNSSITLIAQTGGVVSSINVDPAESVGQGQILLRLSSNWTGGNIPGLQQQLAYQQYLFNKENFDQQKEVIKVQKDIANQTEENSEELRKINQDSVNETQAQLDLNQSILDTVNQNLDTLEEATPSAANDSLILSTKQLKSQFLAAVNQLKQQLRTIQYQTDEDKPPAQLVQLQKELTIKQLELQEKSLELTLEISRLNYQISAVSASLMSPASPIKGIVEKIHVYKNQTVSPGQPLITITGDVQQLDVVLSVPPSLAVKISKLEPSTIYLDSQVFLLIPQHITIEPLQDKQNRVIYHLPLEAAQKTFDGDFLTVEVPIGYPDSVASLPSIPIDAVFQLQDSSFVYLIKDGRAMAKQISLGKIIGGYVEVLDGINSGDVLIISRNVTEGDLVKEVK